LCMGVGVLEGVVSYFPCVNTLGCLGRSTLLTSPQLPPAALPRGERNCTFVACTMYIVHETCSVTKKRLSSVEHHDFPALPGLNCEVNVWIPCRISS